MVYTRGIDKVNTVDYRLRQLANNINVLIGSAPYKYSIDSKKMYGKVTFSVVMYYNTPAGVATRVCHKGSGSSAQAYLEGIRDTLNLIGNTGGNNLCTM